MHSSCHILHYEFSNYDKPIHTFVIFLFRLMNSHDDNNYDSESDNYQEMSKEQVTNMLMETTVSEGEHRLQSPYCLWYSRKSSSKSHQSSFDQVLAFRMIKKKKFQFKSQYLNVWFYFQNLVLVGAFASCEQFWNLYSRLIRPGELTSHSDFHLFKKGIKPLWEVINNDMKVTNKH